MKSISPQKVIKQPLKNGYKSIRNSTAKINIITMYPGFSYKNSKGEIIVPEKLVAL